MRRAFRREPVGGGAAAAGASLGAKRRRTRRGLGARLAALVALLAVAAALVLLVHSLKGASHTKAPPATPVVKVLIPEGKTRLQIAQIARAAGLTGSYRAAAKHSDLLNPVRYGAPHDTPDLEGFLFPATYDMDRGAPASRLVEEQLSAFQENFGAEDVSRAKALGVSPYELLTVASMVEREAQVPADRAKIAAVIYNRLKAGMPLGIDASIYYAVELEKNIATYTHELTESQLRIDSPYNTRTHTGLPPTPISNPGTASIQAAAHPAHVVLPVLRGRGRRLRRAGLLRHAGRVRSERRRLRSGQAEERRPPAGLQAQVRRLGVLGWPVSHSRSPAMHNAALAALGMSGWHYQRLPVPPELLAETVRALGGAGFLGANVTIPHKEAALALADEASDAAREIGAANTLTFASDGSDRRREHRRARAARGARRAGRRDARPGARRGRQRTRGGVGAAGRRRRRGVRVEPHERARGGAGRAARRPRRRGAAEGRSARELHICGPGPRTLGQ